MEMNPHKIEHMELNPKQDWTQTELNPQNWTHGIEPMELNPQNWTHGFEPKWDWTHGIEPKWDWTYRFEPKPIEKTYLPFIPSKSIHKTKSYLPP